MRGGSNDRPHPGGDRVGRRRRRCTSRRHGCHAADRRRGHGHDRLARGRPRATSSSRSAASSTTGTASRRLRPSRVPPCSSSSIRSSSRCRRWSSPTRSTHSALLATEVVRRVRALGRLRIVGVTGSNGKTTTKNLLRTVLERVGATVAPPEPRSTTRSARRSRCSSSTDDTEFLVAEMGASAVGEIARLIRMAHPDVGIVLKVGLAHAGEFGGIEQHRAREVRDGHRPAGRPTSRC